MRKITENTENAEGLPYTLNLDSRYFILCVYSYAFSSTAQKTNTSLTLQNLNFMAIYTSHLLYLWIHANQFKCLFLQNTLIFKAKIRLPLIKKFGPYQILPFAKLSSTTIFKLSKQNEDRIPRSIRCFPPQGKYSQRNSL